MRYRHKGDAQKIARQRNFTIFQLRGAWQMLDHIVWSRDAMRAQRAIDKILKRMKAEPEQDRRARLHLERMRRIEGLEIMVEVTVADPPASQE